MAIIITNEQHNIRLAKVDTQLQIDHIPGMVYRVDLDVNGPKLVKDRPNFKAPEKIYGEPLEYANMIFDDFQKTKGTLGVILEGLKGSGKSLTAELLGNKMIAKGYPVLVVDHAWSAEMIKAWAAVCSPCMVLFDEFGKVYDKDTRKGLLTLFSDTALEQVLFVITANTPDELNEFIINRPGRFKYSISFQNISPMARDQLFDELKLNREMRDIFTAYASHPKLSFDVLNYALREAVQFTDKAAMYKRLNLLNIPYVPTVMVEIKEIAYLEENFEGRHFIRVDNDGTHIELFGEGTTSFCAETFDWETVHIKGPGRFIADASGYGEIEQRTLQISPELFMNVDIKFVNFPGTDPFTIGSDVSQYRPKKEEKETTTEEESSGK